MAPTRSLAAAPLLAMLVTPACLELVDARFDEATLVEACYEGPAGTLDVGVCKAGERTTRAEDGEAGTCEGQVLPGVECGVDDVDEDCDGRTGAHLFSVGFAGGSRQRITAMARLDDGSIVITGYAWGTFVAGGAVVGAGTFVIKLGPEGGVSWAKAFGPSIGSHGESIAADGAGDVVVLVATGDPIDFGGGVLVPGDGTNRDMIVKLDGEDGAHLWSQPVGGDVKDTEDCHVAVRGDGQIVVTGTFLGTLAWPGGAPLATDGASFHMFTSVLTPDGKAVRSADHGPGLQPAAVAAGPDGETLVVGNVAPGSVADLGAGPFTNEVLTSFVAKLDDELGHVWSRALGTATEEEFGRGVAVQPDGTVAVAVPYYGALDAGEEQLVAASLDVGVAAFAPSGELLWARRWGGSGLDSPWDIAPADEGGWVVGGTFQGSLDVGLCPASSAGDFDAFLTKLDAAGNALWIHTFGDPYPDEDGLDDGWPAEVVADVEVAPGGEVIIAGEYNGSVDWGGGPLPFVDAEEGVVARYAR